MYACAMIIYGWDLSGENSRPVQFKNATSDDVAGDVEKVLENMEAYYPKGFHHPYDDGDGAPYAFGVQLGKINGFGNMPVSNFPQSPTDAQEKELNDMVNALDDEDKECIKKFGEPQIFLLWHTS